MSDWFHVAAAVPTGTYIVIWSQGLFEYILILGIFLCAMDQTMAQNDMLKHVLLRV